MGRLAYAWVLAAAASCGTVQVIPRSLGDQTPAEVPPGLDESCHPDTVEGLAHCVDERRLEEDVRGLSLLRSPNTRGHEQVKTACRDRLAALGYTIREQVYEGGVNIIGRKPGFTDPDSWVVLSAHYDAPPDCPAADDNASGVAGILEAARILSTASFDRTVVVACWDGGEQDQAGSEAWLASVKPTFIAGSVVLESIGYVDRSPDAQTVPEGFERIFPDQALAMLDHEYRADFLTMVADRPTEEWAKEVVKQGEPAGVQTYLLVLTDAVKQKQRTLDRTDHASFWDAGVPAMLITDTGPHRNPADHCRDGSDVADALSYPFVASATRVAVSAVALRAGLRSPVSDTRVP